MLDAHQAEHLLVLQGEERKKETQQSPSKTLSRLARARTWPALGSAPLVGRTMLSERAAGRCSFAGSTGCFRAATSRAAADRGVLSVTCKESRIGKQVVPVPKSVQLTLTKELLKVKVGRRCVAVPVGCMAGALLATASCLVTLEQAWWRRDPRVSLSLPFRS